MCLLQDSKDERVDPCLSSILTRAWLIRGARIPSGRGECRVCSPHASTLRSRRRAVNSDAIGDPRRLVVAQLGSRRRFAGVRFFECTRSGSEFFHTWSSRCSWNLKVGSNHAPAGLTRSGPARAFDRSVRAWIRPQIDCRCAIWPNSELNLASCVNRAAASRDRPGGKVSVCAVLRGFVPIL